MKVGKFMIVKIKEIEGYLPTAEQIQHQIEMAEAEYKMKLKEKQDE